MAAAGPRDEDSVNMDDAALNSFFDGNNDNGTAVGAGKGGSGANTVETRNVAHETVRKVAAAASSFLVGASTFLLVSG